MYVWTIKVHLLFHACSRSNVYMRKRTVTLLTPGTRLLCAAVQVSDQSSFASQPLTPRPRAGSLNPFQLADDEDVWHNLSQPAAKLHVNLKQTDSKRAHEVSSSMFHRPHFIQVITVALPTLCRCFIIAI